MHFLQAAQEVLQQAARQLNEADQTWANYILTDDENRPAGWLDEYFRADRPFRWQDDAEEMAETLADCLGERIGERGSLYARQAVWQHVDRWLDAAEHVLSQQAGRPVRIPAEYRPVSPLQIDKDVELVKLLHGKGMTREQLAEHLHLTLRAVQNKLTALSPASSSMALRIAGQVMRVPVSSERIQTERGAKKNTKQFYTPNTLHPIALQLNMALLLTLLHTLYQNRENNDSNMSDILALDIWAQLSDYAKQRLRDLSGNSDMMQFLLRSPHSSCGDFANYLNNLEAELQEECRSVFHTERDLLREGILTRDEEIILLYKAHRTCNIRWTQGGKPQELCNQIIRSFHADRIETVSTQNPEGAVHTLSRSWNLQFFLVE